MNLLDVNVLVYAFRQDSNRHQEYRTWLLNLLNGYEKYGLAEQVLMGMIRITTNPKIFKQPSTLLEAIAFTKALKQPPNCCIIRPSPNHWSIFLEICQQVNAKGNLITDAWLAALAIDSQCVWITCDRDFARFPKLKWKHPLDQDREVQNPA